MSSIVTTLEDLRDEVLSWLDEGGSTGTTATNVDNAINEAHTRRLTAEPWPFLIWDSPETFTLSVGDQLYSLHPEFHRPFYFFNRTKRCYLREISARHLGPSGAKWNTDQDSNRFVLWGRTPVSEQPASATTLRIVSSSPSDSGVAKAITIRGITSNGVETESLTPNGTTPVTGSKSFTKILGVTKAAAWAGTLTLSNGTTTYLTLLSDEWGRSHQQLYLLGSPTSADVIEYRFYRLPRRMESDNDIPDIPPGHERILVWDALIALAAYDNRLDGGRLTEWSKRQRSAEEAMRAAFMEIQPVEAEPQFVRESYDEFDSTAGPVVWL